MTAQTTQKQNFRNQTPHLLLRITSQVLHLREQKMHFLAAGTRAVESSISPYTQRASPFGNAAGSVLETEPKLNMSTPSCWDYSHSFLLPPACPCRPAVHASGDPTFYCRTQDILSVKGAGTTGINEGGRRRSGPWSPYLISTPQPRLRNSKEKGTSEDNEENLQKAARN